MCLRQADLDRISIKHSFNEYGDLLAIYFNPCDFVNKATCERKEAVAEWMLDKDLVVLVNQEAFNHRAAADAADGNTLADPN
jgi:hypothetical protein